MLTDPDQISASAMTTKRQQRFLKAVARAASETQALKPRGRPTPTNLTPEGRALGLCAMRASLRCRSKRRDGEQCKAPALKGATRCVKHGGRVEVPAHPHNIRRFFSGNFHGATVAQFDKEADRDCWDALSSSQQRELAAVVSERVLRSPARLYQAARVWMTVKDGNYRAFRRFLDAFARA